MKFLLHGNAPFVKSGYGVQLAYLGQMLRDDGHEVAYSVTYGYQGGYTTWNGFPLYGCGYDTQSNDDIHMKAGHFFRNDPGWIITALDVWALKNPLLADFNVAAWVPIDHQHDYGPQQNVLDFFLMSKAVPVAMSKFGHGLLDRANLNPAYVPLSVDTSVYTPTFELEGGRDTREFLGIPEDAFMVSIVGMNKGWAKDRKGFAEAFCAFGIFDAMYPEANAHLYVHADALGGMEGIDLKQLQIAAHVQPHKIVFAGGPNQFGLKLGYTAESMAAMYTATDVLLAPSHGEGFCVPLIEAQACGTPCIVNDFSAQVELVPDHCGWRVVGQFEWDPAHHSAYQTPLIVDIVDRLLDAYKADRVKMADDCIAFAKQYDTRTVYEKCWRPLIAELTAAPIKPELERKPMPKKHAVAVLCPIYKRTSNIAQLIRTFTATTTSTDASLYFIVDDDDLAARMAVADTIDDLELGNIHLLPATRGVSCAQKWNAGYEQTDEPWVLCIGDDVRFHQRWLPEARPLSGEFDIIGTNDTTDKPKNPFVARGIHADHFFVRRAYVEEYGACLDGPGTLAPEVYRHWYVDTEIVKLARARGVFTPCLDSVVEHLHKGYDGLSMEERMADPLLAIPVEAQPKDQQAWMERMPLVEQQRTTRANI